MLEVLQFLFVAGIRCRCLVLHPTGLQNVIGQFLPLKNRDGALLEGAALHEITEESAEGDVVAKQKYVASITCFCASGIGSSSAAAEELAAAAAPLQPTPHTSDGGRHQRRAPSPPPAPIEAATEPRLVQLMQLLEQPSAAGIAPEARLAAAMRPARSTYDSCSSGRSGGSSWTCWATLKTAPSNSERAARG